jgi:hypothetical protein
MPMVLYDPRPYAFPAAAPQPVEEPVQQAPAPAPARLSIAAEFERRSMAAQARPTAVGLAMFSSNMSHLRGARPCGSCGGR